jgi:hypothetical protein
MVDLFDFRLILLDLGLNKVDLAGFRLNKG